MADTMDGVKNPSPRRVRPSTASKIEESRGKDLPLRKTGKTSNFNKIFSATLAVILVLVVLSNISYKKSAEEREKSARNLELQAQKESDEARNRLSELETKSKICEDESIQLKTEKTKLEEKTKMLDGAKVEFFNSDLGLKFDYPAVLGDAEAKIENGLRGKRLDIRFRDSSALYCNSFTTDFQSGTSSLVKEIIGFEKKGQKYYLLTTNGLKEENEIRPKKIIETNGYVTLVLDKSSLIGKGVESLNHGVNGVLAVTNLPDKNFKSLNIINQDVNLISMERFEVILKSISNK